MGESSPFHHKLALSLSLPPSLPPLPNVKQTYLHNGLSSLSGSICQRLSLLGSAGESRQQNSPKSAVRKSQPSAASATKMKAHLRISSVQVCPVCPAGEGVLDVRLSFLSFLRGLRFMCAVLSVCLMSSSFRPSCLSSCPHSLPFPFSLSISLSLSLLCFALGFPARVSSPVHHFG